MNKLTLIIGCILLVSLGLLTNSPTQAKIYYEAGVGDVLGVEYQRYEGDATPKDSGTLTVFCSEEVIPTNLKDQYPDAINVVRGFWNAIVGGNTTAKSYWPPMKEGDKKEWVIVHKDDGYTDTGHPLYDQTLYFDIELITIFHDEVVEPLGNPDRDDPWGFDDLLNIPFILPLLGLIAIGVISFVAYKMHGKTHTYLRSRVHCGCAAIATMECTRCFSKSCRECFLKHGGCASCGSNKMTPIK